APDRILHGVLWHRGVYASPPIPLPARCPAVGAVALPRGWRGGLLSRDDLYRADYVVARSLPYHLGVLGGSLHCLRAGTGGVPPATGVTVHAGGRPHLLDHRCPFYASLQPALDRTRPCASRPLCAGALASPHPIAEVFGRVSPGVGAGGGKRAVA